MFNSHIRDMEKKKIRTLSIVKELDEPTFTYPHRLLIDGEKTGVRWNGDTKRELYGPAAVDNAEEEFAYILVQELDQELETKLTELERTLFYGQLLDYIHNYPE